MGKNLCCCARNGVEQSRQIRWTNCLMCSFYRPMQKSRFVVIVPRGSIFFFFLSSFGSHYNKKQDVILVTEAMAIQAQLVRLRESIASDFLWSLYAGSVLVLRDAAATQCSVKVALVDFSYAYPEARMGHDNLLFGVTQLEERLRDWMERKIILKVNRWVLICFYFNDETKGTNDFVVCERS